MRRDEIVDIRAFVVASSGAGGDYHDREAGHWLIDTQIANPMSVYPEYRASRTSWGIAVLGSILVEVESRGGTVGVATALGGPPACFLIEEHFRRFLVGSDPRDINRMWDQMYRASLPYGRKGVVTAAVSAVDLALWDLLGRLRDEPVYAMTGGATRDAISLYCTGPRPEAAKAQGFWGGKVPLPHGPAEGEPGLRRNVEFLAAHRAAVGPDFPLMVDCYMSLDVTYAVALAEALKSVGIHWIEEALSPDDIDGHRILKERCPTTRWTTGEHEYTRYGFRAILESRAIDIVQPDLTWVGGLTEAMRISAMAAAYDTPVVPHGSGDYSYHFVMAQPHIPFCEYVNMSAAGDVIGPIFGDLFEGETLPENGRVRLADRPGFGLTVREGVALERPYVGG
ncbi:L-rhamnonate dehydratase [Bauldia sp.]|uniref:L-rhamnonate dehydratase n=1 Tax=Bauldia sp. TaxID=2575872 RepID=UPI003BAA818E